MASPGQSPENGECVLEIIDNSTGVAYRLDTWKSYRFNSHFLTPTDGWSATLGDDSVGDKLIAALKPGMKVQLKVEGKTQGSGFIDDVEITSDRSGGTEVTITGRDVLAPAVDGCVDPTLKFSDGSSLYDVLNGVFSPFGLSTFLPDNDTNRGVMTGQVRGTPTSKKGKPLKSFVLHQVKPYPNESAYDFASRICQRRGLWIWPSADGNVIIVSRPDFDVGPDFVIRHKRGADGVKNNVLRSSVRYSAEEQPSVIVATGYGTGAENPLASLRVIMVNELTAFDANGNLQPQVQAILNQYPNAKRVPARLKYAPPSPLVQSSDSQYFTTSMQIPTKVSRPMFLHDDESKDIDKLTNFVVREMALRQRRALQAHYTVEGHINSGMPWAVDCCVDVDDDVSNLHERLWVLSRTLIKDRSGGTRTDLELIRQHTLEFQAAA